MIGQMIGRAQVHNWGKDKILILAILPKNFGVSDEDWKLGDELTHKENVKLWDIIDSGDPNTLMFRYNGDVCATHTIGRRIDEYLVNREFWITEDEAEYMYKKSVEQEKQDV